MTATVNDSDFPNLTLEELSQHDEAKIAPMPLLFECEALDILTKELTKLNSSYEYRIVYLGPRWPTSTSLHKKYAGGPSSDMVPNYLAYESDRAFPKYNFAFDQLSKYSAFMESYQREQQSKQTVYYRAFEGMNPTLKDGMEVRFDANFQSGNLDCAVRVCQGEYDLFLRSDSNTRGHTQWFYFSVSSPSRRRIQLNICNLSKGKNLYGKNMKPYVFSTKKFEKFGTRWQQDGINVTCEQKRLRYGFLYDKCRVRAYWQLSFALDFDYADDVVFLAYCVPYTYSLLLKDIDELKTKHSKSKMLEVGTNGRSLTGLSIPLLKITDPGTPDKGKKVKLLVGRIHPGESNGSIVLWGLVQYLCSKEAAQLRKKYKLKQLSSIFVILPMLNPDGVVLGNTRTGVFGKDLNRQYLTTNREIYPEICNIKRIAECIQKRFELHMFLDFHGHSQKKNTFTYGPSYSLGQPQYLKSKVLPKLISLRTDMFRYYSCVFKISENKKSTGRAVMFEEVGIPYTYTVESSNGFYYDPATLSTCQFTRSKWLEMGLRIGEALNEYMIHLLEYEEFMAERRQQRLKKKLLPPPQQIRSNDRWMTAGTTSRKISRDLSVAETENQSLFTQVKAPPTTVYFVEIIQQIKHEDLQPKPQLADDAELDSDSCDQKQDMDKAKQQNLVNMVNRSIKGCSEEELTIQAVVIKSRNRLDSERSQKLRLRDRMPKSLQQVEPSTEDYMDLEMEILNQIIQPKVRTAKVYRQHTAAKTPSLDLPSERRPTARNVETISSRGLRTLKHNELKIPLNSTVQELARRKRSEVMRSTAQEVYSPIARPYILPLREDVKGPVHFSFRKRLNKSEISHNSKIRSLDRSDSPPILQHSLTINDHQHSLVSQPASPREAGKEGRFNYNRLILVPKQTAVDPLHNRSEQHHHIPVSFYRIKQQQLQSKRRNTKNKQSSLDTRCLNIHPVK